jgi:hypothetical protein
MVSGLRGSLTVTAEATKQTDSTVAPVVARTAGLATNPVVSLVATRPGFIMRARPAQWSKECGGFCGVGWLPRKSRSSGLYKIVRLSLI